MKVAMRTVALWGAAVLGTTVLTALTAASMVHAQTAVQHDAGNTGNATTDDETQGAVADYNAGNFDGALKAFRVAAERGNRLAQFNYAMMLINGEGGPVNADEGRKWLRKAADANMSHAQYVFGKMYDDGEFVARDAREAHRWFLRAARQGHVQAELALANQFLDGRGTARDNRQAFYWYEKAAKAGDATAQYVAGSFYERGGDGVTRNLNIARAYYAAAAAQGDPAARLKFKELSLQLQREAPTQPVSK